MTECEPAALMVASRHAMGYIVCIGRDPEPPHHRPSRDMTFTLAGTGNYGPERIEFLAHSSSTENPKAVEIIRWVTDAKGNWYQIWRGFHFVGNARGIYRDRLKKGWVAA